MSSRVLLLTVDGQAAESITPVLERAGMTVSVTRDPQAVMMRLGEHQLIILDATDEAMVALLCRRINDEAGSSHPPILAIARSSDVEERVRLLEAGADDVLAHPIDERELEALVEALLLRAPTATRPQGPQSAVAARPHGAPGRAIAFAAAKGGSGTTTLAVNTALVLAEMAPGNVAIADFDMFHGQVSTHLDIYARTSTAALAREDPASLTPEAIRDAGRRHSSGLTVFGGPYRPDDAAGVSSGQLIGVAEALKSVYGTVIVDVGSTLDTRALEMLDQADRLAIVVIPDIPSLRLLHSCLQILSEEGTAADRSVFVVNQIYPKAMIGAEQIEEHLGISIGLQIPYDGESFLRAINVGQPLVTIAHRSPAAMALRTLASRLTDATLESDVVVMPSRKRGGFRGLIGRN